MERHEIPLAQTLLLVKGSRGIAACPYLNVEMFEKTGEACIIIPAARIDGMLDSKVSALTPKARELGIEIGMPGARHSTRSAKQPLDLPPPMAHLRPATGLRSLAGGAYCGNGGLGSRRSTHCSIHAFR